MSAASNLAAIKKTYRLVDESFDAVYARCKTDAQRRRLTECRDAARDAYWAAIAANLADNHGLVAELTGELREANAAIAAKLEDLRDVTEFLARLTRAVKLAAALATLAAG